jgi:aldose 1-epimerase
MIRLDHGDSAALIDDTCGGRLASLKVRGTELIVGAESAESDFGWGIYPMVPFAGRVRNGRFNFQGKDYQLAKRMPPHAIHGTVDDTVWEVMANDEKSTTMRNRTSLKG